MQGTDLVSPLPSTPEQTPLRAPSARRMGAARRLGVAALCLVSAGTGAVGALGAVAMASPVAAVSDSTRPGAATGVLDAAGDSQVIIDVAAAASPAVVTITVTPDVTPNSTRFQLGGTGSGVIIDASGLILTNHHVVSDATNVTVQLSDGREFAGTVAGIDTLTDLAFVKIEGTDLPTVALGESSSLKVGQLAIAIGSPLGRYPGSVTAGIVSGLDRTVDVASQTGPASNRLRHLIQTDAAINPGNSGGPLLDGDGKVIGINTAEAGSAQSIAFAIPIDLAKPIIEQVKAGEAIARPWIGIQYTEVDAQLAKDQGLGVDHGALIQQAEGSSSPAVVVGSPAEAAGLKVGDIITAMDDQAIDLTHPLDLVLLAHAPGDSVSLTVLRDGASIQVEVTLGTRPASLAQ
jgi:serine protease Do